MPMRDRHCGEDVGDNRVRLGVERVARDGDAHEAYEVEDPSNGQDAIDVALA